VIRVDGRAKCPDGAGLTTGCTRAVDRTSIFFDRGTRKHAAMNFNTPNAYAPKPHLKIWLDGRIVPVAEAKISIFDHGLLYGDGVFEGMRSYR
jgi:hypothetical protein